MINYSNLLKGNIIVNCKIDVLKLQTNSENKKYNNKLNNKLFIERIRKKLSAFHQFRRTPQLLDNIITVYYTQVNNFYNDLSIIKFLTHQLQKKKLNEKEIEQLLLSCEHLFFIDTKKINKLYTNRDQYNINLDKDNTLFNFIEIKFKFDNEGNIEFKFDNIDKYSSVKLILFYFKLLFSTIHYEIKQLNNNSY